MSEENSTRGQTLRDLLAKMSHPLLEVRTRSLRSLSLKLRGGLVDVESLVREKTLLCDLLQWFNFPEWGGGQLPLGLLETLAENEVAAASLVEIGAVEFLSRLRQSCDPSLYPSIDDILEKLLRVPHTLLPTSSPPSSSSSSSSTAVTHSRVSSSILPSSHTTPVTTVAASVTQDPVFSLCHPLFSPAAGSSECHVAPLLQTTGAMTSPCITTTSMTSHYITPAGGPRVGKGVPSDAPHSLVLTHGPNTHLPMERGYVQSAVPNSRRVEQEEGRGGEGEGERGEGRKAERRIFPWLRLSVNDVYILRATESHLQRSDSFVSSCNFLEDVLFRDFPPEVFLQRPALLRVMFTLLTCDVGMEHGNLTSVYHSLSALNSQLAHRINSIETAATDYFTFNDIHIHTQQQGLTSAAVELTNQIQQRESHDLEQLTQDMLVQLRSSDVSLKYYCSSQLAAVTQHLSTYLSREGVREGIGEGVVEGVRERVVEGVREGGGGNTTSINACLQLLTSVVGVVEAVGQLRREGGGGAGEDWGAGHICTALSDSLSLWKHISKKCPPGHAPVSTHLSHVCHVTVSLAQCLCRVLVDCADCCVEVSSLTAVVREMAMRGVVMLAVPELHSKLCNFLEILDADSYQVFQAIEKLFVSFQNMSACVKHACNSEATPISLAYGAELVLAMAALPGLWTFSNYQFIEREVRVAMTILKAKEKQEEWNDARLLLLHLLAHGSNTVQVVAYQTLKEVVLSQPSSFPPSLGVLFLETLCCHGSLSASHDVSQTATAILSAVLSAVMAEGDSEARWMTEPLVQRLPFIEASLMDDDGLFAIFCEFLESKKVSDLERLHSLIRMMFSSSQELRKFACDSLLKLRPTPAPPTSFSFPLHNTLVTGPVTQTTTGENSGLERSDIGRLLGIVRSSVIDDLLKRSALEQLAMLLTDTALHRAAIEEGTVNDVLDVFKLKLKPTAPQEEGVQGPNSSLAADREPSTGEMTGEVEAKGFWKACIQCLRQLVVTSGKVRGQLAGDGCFLLDIVRVSMECASDPEFLHASVVLLAALIFPLSPHWTSHHTLELPKKLVDRLIFTFPVGSYEPENPHKTPCLMTPSQISHLPDPHLLSLLYHTAMAGGVEELLTKPTDDILADSRETQGEDKERETTHDLRAVPNKAHPPGAVPNNAHLTGAVPNNAHPPSAGDLLSLRLLWSPSAVVRCLSQLCEARSHAEVICWLDHMTMIGECCWYEVMMTSCSEEEHERSRHSGRKEIRDDWERAFGRFLQVEPATSPDKSLLSHLLLHLTTTLLHVHSGASCSCLARRLYGGAGFLPWLVIHTASAESVCLQTLRSLVERQGDLDEGERQLEKALLHYFTALCLHLSPSASPSVSLTPSSLSMTATANQCLPILQTLCLRLRYHDSPQPLHSSLPSLHASLTCLTHCTASLCSSWKGWSEEGEVMATCTHLASSLRQTVCSVMSGRGQMTSSFMGQGIIQKASLSLSLLLRGVASIDIANKWYSCCADKDDDFSWLHILTNNRDSQVRCAGYSVLASVCAVKGVAEKLTVECAPNVNFGLWGVCMRVGRDLNEWSLTRRQVLLVLVSLTGLCQRQGLWDQLLTYRDEKLPLNGLSALEVFLHHYPPTQLLATTPHTHPTITAPALQLIGNLSLSFPSILHAKLEPLTDFGNILIKCCVAISGSHGNASLLMCRAALTTLRVLVVTGSKVMLELLLLEDTLNQICQLLTVGNQGECSGVCVEGPGECSGVCVEVMQLLECLLCKASPQMAHLVTAALLSQWTNFTNIILLALRCPSLSSSLPLCTLSLSLLHTLLAHKLHPPNGFDHTPFNTLLTTLLDSDPSDETESKNRPSGGLLCGALLDVYEGSEVTLIKQKGCGHGVGLVSNVLCLLLASSHTAKQTALKGGLLDSSLEVVKGLHSQLLSTDSPQRPSDHPSRSRAPVQVPQMCERLNIIKNLLYHSTELKSAAGRCGVVGVVSGVWTSCTATVALARAVLDMLTVFTAGNNKGQAALAASSRGIESLLYRVANHASHCLVSHRSCVAARTSSPLAKVLAASLTLMTNCALSPEGRRVLKKAGFLSNFSSLSLRPPRPSPSAQRQCASYPPLSEPQLLVKLFVNLTFASDGQQMVIKTPGVVDILLDLYRRPDLVQSALCLLVLRNLCFYGPGKTLLVENENFLSVLTSGLESREVWERAVAASAVWALTHNSAKIRKTLRTAEICQKLEHLHSSLSLQRRTTSLNSLLSPVHHLYHTNLTNALHNLR